MVNGSQCKKLENTDIFYNIKILPLYNVTVIK